MGKNTTTIAELLEGIEKRNQTITRLVNERDIAQARLKVLEPALKQALLEAGQWRVACKVRELRLRKERES